MRTPPPPRLYKYQPYTAQALTALKVRTLWFGRPAGLNDPYDCAVPLRFAPVTLEDCGRFLAARTDEHWLQVRRDPQYVGADGQPTELLRTTIERAGREAIQDAADRNYRERGVTCFSETPDNTLLWSHYGAGHRGLCLEFDTGLPVLNRLHQVRYAEEIPQIDLINVLLGDTAQVLWGLLTKAACWSYEREWRAIHKAAETVYCYGIEPLRAVYLGAALTDAEKDVVAHLLHGTPTRLYEMRRSASAFRLEAQPVEYAPYKHDVAPAV